MLTQRQAQVQRSPTAQEIARVINLLYEVGEELPEGWGDDESAVVEWARSYFEGRDQCA